MLKIKSGECHIWYFNSNDVSANLVNMLSEVEKIRYSSYKFKKDKSRFLKSATSLRILLSLYTKISVDNLIICRKCNECGKYHGKPKLINFKEINFSVSYSQNMIVIALYKNHEIGIDIEFINYDFPYEEIIEETLATGELKKYNIMCQNEKLKNFYFYWTIKEALTKASGNGLNDNFNRIEIDQDNDSIKVIKYPNLTINYQDISLRSMAFQDNYMLSLAVFDSLKVIKFFNESEIKNYY